MLWRRRNPASSRVRYRKAPTYHMWCFTRSPVMGGDYHAKQSFCDIATTLVTDNTTFFWKKTQDCIKVSKIATALQTGFRSLHFSGSNCARSESIFSRGLRVQRRVPPPSNRIRIDQGSDGTLVGKTKMTANTSNRESAKAAENPRQLRPSFLHAAPC